MGGLIYQPSGCGEENMIHMTLPVIAVTYLDRADLWEVANIDQRHQALQHITTGKLTQTVNTGMRDFFFKALCVKTKGHTWQ